MNEEAIAEELTILAERMDRPRKILDQMMLKEPIHRLHPRQPPVCVPIGQPVTHAIELMRRNGIGSVLITENQRLVGILTERDVLCKITAIYQDPRLKRVEEIMTRDPACLGLEDPIVFALNRMGVGGFRHVPLVDEKHHPVGLISVRHLVRYMVDFFAHEVINLPPSPGNGVASQREGA
jgi:CBS domain-containing protein